MAEDFIEEIYREAYLIPETKKLISFCRSRNLNALQEEWKKMIDPITETCRSVVYQNSELGNSIWESYLSARDRISQSEFEATASELEKVIPLMKQAMKLKGEIDVTEAEIRLFSSESGFLNLEDTGNNIVFYSMADPVWEKYELAKSIYNPKMNKVCILGCGLGYLAWQLYIYANESIDVYIYDTSDQIVEYAFRYGVLDNIPKEKLHIVVDERIESLLLKYTEFFDEFKCDEAVYYIEEFFENTLNEKVKTIVKEINKMVQTRIDFGKMFERNHYYNLFNVNETIDDIILNKCTKEWLVIGGGPSVDDNLSYIKESLGKKNIIAATTIYKKLVNEGIQPDYIAAIDPQNRTYGHLENVKNSETPLIITDTANWQFGNKYIGEKYIVETAGNYFSSPRANKNEWYSNGTVTAFCIDVAAYLGASSIEMIGVDLSYPTNHTHACGTMDDSPIETSSMIKVKSVTGGEVFTDEIMRGYISDIESQIKKYSEISFFNLSKNGAYIAGCSTKNC